MAIHFECRVNTIAEDCLTHVFITIQSGPNTCPSCIICMPQQCQKHIPHMSQSCAWHVQTMSRYQTVTSSILVWHFNRSNVAIVFSIRTEAPNNIILVYDDVTILQYQMCRIFEHIIAVMTQCCITIAFSPYTSKLLPSYSTHIVDHYMLVLCRYATTTVLQRHLIIWHAREKL